MEYFCILTMKFLSQGNLHRETLARLITADAYDGDTAENLFWRAYHLFEEEYHCESFGIVLHWSITPNHIPQQPSAVTSEALPLTRRGRGSAF